jgi:hypothetical protein
MEKDNKRLRAEEKRRALRTSGCGGGGVGGRERDRDRRGRRRWSSGTVSVF